MTVHDVDAVGPDQAGDVPCERWAKPGLPAQGDHGNVEGVELISPSAALVEAAHHRVHAIRQLFADLDDQALGAARREAKHELHHTALTHGVTLSQWRATARLAGCSVVQETGCSAD